MELFAWINTTVCTQTLLACNFFLEPTVLFNIEKRNMMLYKYENIDIMYYRQFKSLWWAYAESSTKTKSGKNKQTNN